METEENYNLRVEKKNSNKCINFDRKEISYHKNTFEFCDLLTNKFEIIHVKRYRSSTSSLSHIFTQAIFSSKVLVSSSEVRKEILKKIPTTKDWVKIQKTFSDYDPKQYTVTFVILKDFKDQKETDLPLLFKLTLMEVVNIIQSYGYNFRLVFVNKEEDHVKIEDLTREVDIEKARKSKKNNLDR